ncbi:hypothetical protein B5S28_g4353 [[Candida] boidinii]|nr:hypothetical protein B5S28_g4353 [[Candida] boidinii]OWB63754.1 hypothetical protein B5S29_g4761 [[Candida] boidinii]OWB75036.1 hypothetical protein B5S31_g4886 [[Candida] boidinii]OWB80655.1 hypothetical protein B5S32_g4945 [[Candida] boidinii]
MSSVFDTFHRRDLSTLAEDTASYSQADMAWVLVCSVFVMILTPAGIGLFYGGALKRKNVVQILFQSYMVTAAVTVWWYLFGYSLAVSPSSSKVMGNFSFGALQNIDALPFTDTIPQILYFVFSIFFPVATIQIFLGAVAERGRVLPSIIVGLIWGTVCYCPFAYSTWSANGWLYQLGDLDFAGGGPVHIASGVSSLAYSLFLGPRKEWKDPRTNQDYRPSNPGLVFLGVTIIWGTWLCFNSGTMLSVSVRTCYIMANTQIAASSAALTFAIVDYFISGTKKWSVIKACEGAIVGLVNITPSCGYISPYYALITSVFDAIICRLLYDCAEWMGIDDTTHSFVVHGVGGIIGSICTGVFASPYIAGLDGATVIDGGWIFHNWVQMGYQFAAFTVITVWSFVGTYAICFIVDKIPGLKLRASEEAEIMGMDLYELQDTFDEFANDYTDFLCKHGITESDILSIKHVVTNRGKVEVVEHDHDNSGSGSSIV